MADEPKTDAPAPAPAPAPAIKPGYKTTEFWLSTAATLVGALMAIVPNESKAMQYLGLAAMVLSVLGYGVVRKSIKNAAQVILIVMVPFVAVGCCTGTVRADAIKGLNADVCNRHDAFIKGELKAENLSEADKALYLRSSQLLRKAIQEASQ